MGNFIPVPDVSVGQSFPPSLWESAIMNNLNLGVVRQLAPEVILSGSVASISFTSIPQTFAHLMLVMSLESDQSTDQDLYLRLNGDTGSNYRWQRLYAQATSTIADYDGGALVAQTVLGKIPKTGVTARSSIVAHLPAYTDTTRYKGHVATFTSIGGSIYMGVAGGQWANANAITQLTILPAAGNLATGRVTLYGLPA